MISLIAVFLGGVTIYRARQSGMEWIAIIAVLSKYFNFLIGGDLYETFSARTGRHVRDSDAPAYAWNICCLVLDCAFIVVERNHCHASARRKIEYDMKLCGKHATYK